VKSNSRDRPALRRVSGIQGVVKSNFGNASAAAFLTADRGGYNLSAYVLAILVHIYNSLINMGCLHILPHI
jgi:hypothetical protein